MKSFCSFYENGYLGLVSTEAHLGFSFDVRLKCFSQCAVVVCILPGTLSHPRLQCVPLCTYSLLASPHRALQICHYFCLSSAGLYQDSVHSWRAGTLWTFSCAVWTLCPASRVMTGMTSYLFLQHHF